jgi:hypothetical protein
MTDGFKGYVTAARLSPFASKNSADLTGIACKKSFERAGDWSAALPKFLYEQ